MKKSVLFTVVLLMASVVSMEIAAQEHLAALIKKCENIDSVELNVVRKRDPKTGELQPVATTVRIHSNPALINEFLEAFKKDEKQASESVEKKKNGKINFFNCKFGDVTYSFSQEDDNSAVVSETKGDRRQWFFGEWIPVVDSTNSTFIRGRNHEITHFGDDFDKRTENYSARGRMGDARKQAKERRLKALKEQEGQLKNDLEKFDKQTEKSKKEITKRMEESKKRMEKSRKDFKKLREQRIEELKKRIAELEKDAEK